MFSLTSAAAVTCGIIRPGIDARIVDQEGRQAAHLGIDQDGGAALLKRPTSHSAMAMVSAAKATGWAWKLPPLIADILVRKHDWIVGHGAGFDGQSAGGIDEQVERGAHHLRLAAEAVGVLDLAAAAVAGDDRAAIEQAADCGGDADLAGLAAQLARCAGRTA